MNSNEQSVVSTDFKSALNDKKLFIETYGCQMNVADSEVVLSIMSDTGFGITQDAANAAEGAQKTAHAAGNAPSNLTGSLTSRSALDGGVGSRLASRRAGGGLSAGSHALACDAPGNA